MQCRICYDGAEDSTLLNPCLCKGETGAMHQSCLATWIRVSKRLKCEVCKAAYDIPELVLEPSHSPHPLLLRLATHPYFVFSECLLMDIAYVISHYSLYPSSVLYNAILGSIPYILLIVIATQSLVMWPAIAKIRDKGRYLRYMNYTFPGVRFSVVSHYFLACAWFILSWIFPILSSLFFLIIISKFYKFHCALVNYINGDALHRFLANSV
jgi:hypothetical protein